VGAGLEEVPLLRHDRVRPVVPGGDLDGDGRHCIAVTGDQRGVGRERFEEQPEAQPELRRRRPGSESGQLDRLGRTRRVGRPRFDRRQPLTRASIEWGAIENFCGVVPKICLLIGPSTRVVR
jgi:hypothetical protein